MKTVENLRKLYKNVLIADLTSLEKERVGVDKKLRFISLIIVAIVLYLTIPIIWNGGVLALKEIQIYWGKGELEDLAFFCLVLIWRGFISLVCYGLLGIVSYRFAKKWLAKDYSFKFKKKIIRRIVEFIDSELKYKPELFVTEDKFKSSNFFTRSGVNRYSGEDLVYGMLDKTKIEFSEITALRVEGSGSDSKTRTIFKGIFFIADFNKNLSGKTYVLPDKEDTWLNRLFEKHGGKGQLVKLEDLEFEDEFAVYSDNQIEARYILTYSLMKRLLDFKRKTKKNIRVAFSGSCIYVAIPYERNLFEPGIHSTIIDFEPIKEYYEDLMLPVGIVEDLNLNTRIWTKQ